MILMMMKKNLEVYMEININKKNLLLFLEMEKHKKKNLHTYDDDSYNIF